MFTVLFSMLASSLLLSHVQAADHQIMVGGSSLTYTPSNITAQAGDTLTFSIQGASHSATQSSFSDPCAPLASSGGQAGFDSGLLSPGSTFVVTVNDSTTPIWVYCQQVGHCKAGMVFAANAPTSGSTTFSAFQQIAMGNAAAPSSSGSAGSSSSASPSPSPASTGSTSPYTYGNGGRQGIMVEYGLGFTGIATVFLFLLL